MNYEQFETWVQEKNSHVWLCIIYPPILIYSYFMKYVHTPSLLQRNHFVKIQLRASRCSYLISSRH